MPQFKLYWKYDESKTTEEDEQQVVEELLDEFEGDVELGEGRPFEKSFEKDIALLGSYLVVNHIDTLATVYKLLKDRAEIHQIRISDAESNAPVFQIATGDGTNIAAEGDVTIVDADDVTLAYTDDDEELREIQKEHEEEIIEELEDVRDED